MEDHISGQAIVYGSRFTIDPNDNTKGTTEIMAYNFGTSTLAPVPTTIYTSYGCGDTKEGQLQMSPDGGKLGWWKYDAFLAGFSYRTGEIHSIPLNAARTAINGSVSIAPISAAGSYGNGMFDFMKNSPNLLYAQRGVYKEGTSPNEYDRNVWKYDPVNLTALAVNPNSSPLISYLFGEIKRGTDGNYYIPNMSKPVDKVHSYNGAAWNSDLAISDSSYRLSSSLPTQVYKVFDASAEIEDFTRSIGHKNYELKDHLGNVRVVLSDAKDIVSIGTNSAIVDNGDEFYSEVVNFNDYYAFGMQMPGRKYQSSASYRYGFNGKENDNEVKGAGNSQDYGLRIYDPRLGRFLSVDPLAKTYPYKTPYDFAENDVIRSTDLDGAEKNINTLNLPTRSKYMGVPGQDYGFGNSNAPTAAANGGYMQGADMPTKYYFNPNAMDNSSTTGHYFYQNAMPRSVTTSNTQMPPIVPQPPQNNNFAANIGFVRNQPALTVVGQAQVNAIAQRIQNTVTQTNGPVATQVQTSPIQNSEGLPGTVTTVTQNQPIQIVTVTSNVTINLATSMQGTNPNAAPLLQQRFNNIRTQLIGQGVPAGNISMGNLSYGLIGAPNQTTFNVQTNTTTQNGNQTTTTTTTSDYTYGE